MTSVAETKRPGPLTGVRVLDLTSVIMGPYSTMTLGDLGADVIAVAPPRGEEARTMGGGPHPELSGIALNLLRNKRSIELDFKQPKGRDALLAIVATCDVMITNLRPGPLKRAGLSYGDICAVRPDIIFCEARGFASGTPDQDKPAYDDIIQAETGMADLAHRLWGEPRVAPTIMADKICGLTIAYSVLAALYRRSLDGLGEHIEIPMKETMTAFMLVEHGALAIPRPAMGKAGYERIFTPNRRPWPTLDGWLMVLPYSTKDYDVLFTSGNRLDLVGDERYATHGARIANANFLYGQMGEVLATRATEDWIDTFTAAGVAVARIVTLDDLVEQLPDGHHPAAGDYKVIPPPMRFASSEVAVRRQAPLIGEHTRELLAEVGYTEAELDELISSGALGAALGMRPPLTASPAGPGA